MDWLIHCIKHGFRTTIKQFLTSSPHHGANPIRWQCPGGVLRWEAATVRNYRSSDDDMVRSTVRKPTGVGSHFVVGLNS